MPIAFRPWFSPPLPLATPFSFPSRRNRVRDGPAGGSDDSFQHRPTIEAKTARGLGFLIEGLEESSCLRTEPQLCLLAPTQAPRNREPRETCSEIVSWWDWSGGGCACREVRIAQEGEEDVLQSNELMTESPRFGRSRLHEKAPGVAQLVAGDGWVRHVRSQWLRRSA